MLASGPADDQGHHGTDTHSLAYKHSADGDDGLCPDIHRYPDDSGDRYGKWVLRSGYGDDQVIGYKTRK